MTKKLLLEFITVDVREITSDERNEALAFQEMTKLLMENFQGRVGRGIADFRQYQNLKKSLKKFHNYPWFGKVSSFLQNYDSEFLKHINARRIKATTDFDKFRNNYNSAVAAFKQGNIPAVRKHMVDLNKITHAYTFSSDTSFIRNMKNPIHIENPLIFQTNDFIRQFENADMQALISKDLTEYKFTYLSMPERKANNFQYMVHWIQQLRNTSKPVELAQSEYEKFTKFIYDSDQYDNLTKMVDRYLTNNDKKLIPQILEEIAKYPALISANNKKKSEITKVYRGLGFSDEWNNEENRNTVPSQNEIIAKEKENTYVAASTAEYVAKRFSYQVGHLESLRNRRSDVGVIITYSVKPDDIILDTSIFGGKFGESEIIINAKNAKVIDFDVSYKDSDPEYDDESDD